MGEVSYLDFLLKLNKPTGNSTKRCIKIFLVSGYFTSVQVRPFPPLRVFPHLYQFEKVFQLLSLRTYFFLLPENKCLNFFPFCLVALSLEGNHEEAIKVREGETLEIYRKHLGDRHPFTATILNNLSNNYSALGEYDIAKQYSEEALKIRRELLKDHYDTAKSLFDLGMVHKNREEFKDAKAYLRECESMQRFLDDPTMISELERLVYTVIL